MRNTPFDMFFGEFLSLKNWNGKCGRLVGLSHSLCLIILMIGRFML